MTMKEIGLIAADLGFYITGRSDMTASDTASDAWLYPLDLEYQLRREAIHFDPKDEEGIPIRRYPGRDAGEYLVCRITAYAIAHWNRWRLQQAPRSRVEFLRIVDWLLREPEGRFGHAFAAAGMAAGWITCIAQGEAASVLARAYVLTGEERYREQARKAVSWLERPIADGGLLDRLPDGKPFLEEYPGSAYRHVLNGCLYAIVGIHDMLRVAPGEKELAALFTALCDAVGSNAHAWDVGGWSTYDYPYDGEKPRNLNTMTYQVLQVALLRHLGKASGDERLTALADKWDRSAKSPAARMRALYRKTTYRLAAGW